MSDTLVRPSPAAAPELLPAPEVSLRKAVNIGLLGGLAITFVGVTGMAATFDLRWVVYPLIALSYVTIAGVAFTFGYAAGRPAPTLEGFAPAVPGRRNVQAGLVAGAVSGVFMAIAMVFFFQWTDLSRIFINLTPHLLEVMTFHQPMGIGLLLMAAYITFFGMAGAYSILMPRRWRRALLYSFAWLVALGLMQITVGQMPIFRQMPNVIRFFYSIIGGLTVPGGIIVFSAAFLIAFFTDRPMRRLKARILPEDATPKRKSRTALIALLVAAPVLVLLPRIIGPFLSEVLDLAGVFLLMALGLNIVVGFAGLLDLGYVAFFAVGAYTTAVLTSPSSPFIAPELTFWLAIPFVLLAAGIAGLAVGTPVLRMRGDYLAIVTLGFGEIARIAFLSDAFKPYFGGAQGMLSIPDIPFFGTVLNDSATFFPVIYAFAILFAYISYALQDSRMGRAWAAMREDEPIAEVMGVNIVTAKLSAFVMGAMLAGVGGSLFAHKIGSVFPESFAILVSITVLVVIIVGGMGSVPGVVVGALVLIGLPELLREFEEFKFLIYGALLIFMMLKKPEGFIPSRRRAEELHEDEVAQDAWLAQQSAATSDGEA